VETQPKSTRFKALLIVLILGTVAILYYPTLSFDFVWDDRNLILNDARLRSIEGLKQLFYKDFFRSSDEQQNYGYYRPIVNLSLAADLAIWRTWAGGFHATNLVLHGLCSVGVFLLSLRMRMHLLVAGAIGLIFAVHPIHTESVTWISGRTDILATLFSLIYLLNWDHEKRLRRTIAVTAFAAALLSKELAIVTPLLGLLLSSETRPIRIAARIRPMIPVGIVALLYLPIRLFLVPVRPSVGAPDGLAELVFSPLAGLSHYLRMMTWPGVQSAYLKTPPSGTLLDSHTAFGLAIVLLIVWLRLLTPRIGRVGLALLVSLLPMSNWVRVAAPADMGFPISERFAYLPSAMLLLLIGILFSQILVYLSAPRRPVWLGLGLVGTLMLGGAYAQTTAARNPVWENDLSLFEDLYTKTKQTPLIEWQYAGALRRFGKENEAHRLVTGAVRRLKAAGIPVPTNMLITMAITLATKGKVKRARRFLLKNIKKSQRTSFVSYNLGVFAEHEGERKKAIRHYSNAVKLRADSIVSWLALGIAQLKMGRTKKAISSLSTAHTLDPLNVSTLHALGLAHRENNNTAQAKNFYLKALALEAHHIDATIDLAALVLEHEPKTAWALIEGARTAHPKNLRLMDTQRALIKAGVHP
jgi:tetratricopeptide (TPR) repeat protein